MGLKQEVCSWRPPPILDVKVKNPIISPFLQPKNASTYRFKVVIGVKRER